nr:alpha/beta hydrolase [Paenibacillus forsythiae]
MDTQKVALAGTSAGGGLAARVWPYTFVIRRNLISII